MYPSSFIYQELQTFPLIQHRLVRIVKYWFKILRLNTNNPVRIIYDLLLNDSNDNSLHNNWASYLRDVLFENGFGYVWIDQCVSNETTFISQFHQRIKDGFIQNNTSDLSRVSDHRLYKLITVESSFYLRFIKDRSLRRALSKIRLGSHNFMIERGRWQHPKINYPKRTCIICNEIEDEYHVIMVCQRTAELRKKYLPRHLYVRPSMFKFINFVNTATGMSLRNFSIFCHKLVIWYDKSNILR